MRADTGLTPRWWDWVLIAYAHAVAVRDILLRRDHD